MVFFFVCFSVFMGFLSFIMFDPLKSSFFLIFSMLLIMPVLSLINYIWFSYFICLLFLSGIFVILVYFSSLSKLVYIFSGFFFVLFFFLFVFLFFSFSDFFLNLNIFYINVYFFFVVFILFCLVYFMNFSSYFLSFTGALRKF